MVDEADLRQRNLYGLSEDAPLWRVFKVDYLLTTIRDRQNILVKPALWDDPFENFMGRCNARLTRAGVNVSLRGLFDAFYGQCWTGAEAETDATWRIYVPVKQRGARVRVRAGRLFDSIWDTADPYRSTRSFLGPVSYLTEDEIKRWVVNEGVSRTFDPSGLGMAGSLFIKRPEFAHEQEVRLLHSVIDSNRAREDRRAFPCDPNSLFEEIVLDPRFDAAEARQYEAELQRLGYRGPIRQSTLYRIPSFPILTIDD